MDSTPDLDRLTGGRIINLKGMFDAEELYAFGQNPFRRCDDCIGTGVAGVAMGLTAQGLLFFPVKCTECNGKGEIQYMTTN